MSRRRQIAPVVTVALAAGMVLAATSVASAAASPSGQPLAAVSATPTRSPVDRGVVVDLPLPKYEPATAELGLGFPKNTIFSVKLYENASTGFTWAVDVSGDPEVVTALGTDVVWDEPVMPGSGGTRYFRYLASGSGEATIRFRYARSWESVPPMKQVTLQVSVR